jgi:hypothetical protein
MKKALSLFASVIILCVLVSFPVKTEARPLQSLSLSMLSPANCPSAGCAAGQRINARAEFSVAPEFFTGPNTQVCLYTTQEGGNDWAGGAIFDINTSGYTAGEADLICTDPINIPTGTVFWRGAFAQLGAISSTQFDFAFRINNLITTAGALYVSIYEVNSTGITWTRTGEPFELGLSAIPVANPSYVAINGIACSSNNPCYLNSGDDLAEGMGTGLKDAVDASPTTGTIHILGTYSIKSNTVSLTNPQIIQGDGDATLTYTGVSCSNPMLQVTDGATIQNLNIHDGNCTSPSRDLISIVNSPADVRLLSNDLINGKNAVSILSGTGSITIRFNQIVGNTGYGILNEPGIGSGIVKAVANNIFNNRTGAQVECNGNGEMNHNFWGSGTDPGTAISNCAYTAGKQLGAAIVTNAAVPGVNALSIPLTGTKTSIPSFGNLISLLGTAGSNVIIANHGHGGSGNIPFLGMGSGGITACNNFYDIFISDESSVSPTSMNLYLKYDLNPACTMAIESTLYCGSLIPSQYPLYWYDPQNSVTEGWDTTGQIPAGSGAGSVTGQTTTCDSTNKEIGVVIDSNMTKRPNLSSDLNFTPFVVGYFTDVKFQSFSALAGVARVDLSWETSKEAGLNGYYVIRSTNENGPYSRDSSFIPAKGDATIGGIYTYSDIELGNGTTYWYKLELVDIFNTSVGFHGPVSATTFSMIPTATDVIPSSAEIYGPSISIKITGNNFLQDSVVVWDSNLTLDLNTSFINSTELTAIIPNSLFTGSSLHSIKVFNPGPGGGFSPPLTFTIKNPVPVISSISPDYSDGNITTITVDVTGDYFVSTSKVRFNGSDSNVTTTFIDRYHLRAAILKSKLTAGLIQITVYNPSYGGGISGYKSFTLFTPTPTITRTPTVRRTNTPYNYKSPTPYRSSTSAYRSPTPYRTRTRTPTITRTGTILITPSVTQQITINLTQSITPGPSPSMEPHLESSATPSLAPGEPTYTPEPPSQGELPGGSSIWSWRLLSGLRVLGGMLLGIGLLSIPAFFIFSSRTRNRKNR